MVLVLVQCSDPDRFQCIDHVVILRYPHQLFADSGVTAERLQNYPGMW
jgi:hypothetical protein